jgi:hypothetical protein
MATLAVTNTFSAGTTIVAADMNTNFDDIEAFVNTTPGVVQADIVDAKGDIVAASAADTVSRLAVGTDTYVLTADSGEATGLKWAAPTTGDITGVTAGTNISGGGASGTVTVNLAVDAAVDMGTDGSGVDVTFHSDTAGDYALWDSSEEKLILEGTNAATVLDVTDGNVSIGDGTLAVSGAVTVGTDGAGADVTFHSATASDNFLWDASDEKLVITGTDGANALEVADGDVEITDALTVTGTSALNVTGFSDSVVSQAQMKDYAETVNALGSKSAAFNVDFEDGNVQTVTITSGTFNIGLTNSLASHSNSVTILGTDLGAGTPSFVAGAHGGGGNAVVWAGGTAPTYTASGTDVLCFTTFDGGTTFYGFAAGLDFS